MKYTRIRFFRKAEPNKIEIIKAVAKSPEIENVEIKIQKVRKKQPQIDEMETLGKIMRVELGTKPLESRIVKHKKERDSGEKPYKSKIIGEEELVQHVEEGMRNNEGN